MKPFILPYLKGQLEVIAVAVLDYVEALEALAGLGVEGDLLQWMKAHPEQIAQHAAEWEQMASTGKQYLEAVDNLRGNLIALPAALVKSRKAPK